MPIRDMIVELITDPAGYEVSILGKVHVFRDNCGGDVNRFAVVYTDKDNNYCESIHDNAGEAADKFLNIRHENKFGLDYVVS